MRELSGKSPMRGRNGWFQAREVSAWGGNSSMITDNSPTVEVGIHSKQYGSHPPIWMWMTLEDAKLFVGELTNAIVDAENSKTVTVVAHV